MKTYVYGSLSLNTSVCMQSLGVPKATLSLTPVASSGVPQITLGLNNSVEGLSECTESCYPHGSALLPGKDTG